MHGGLAAIERHNEQKAALIYSALDELSDFYSPTVTDVPNRSRMNVTFRLPSEALTDELLRQAEARGMIGLKGYRTVGGIRASIYNACPRAAIESLVAFMKEFEQANRAAAKA